MMAGHTFHSEDHEAVIRRLAEAFGPAGHELVLVGGYNRNRALGLVPRDLDFATDALPEESLRLLEAVADRRPDGTLSLYGYGQEHGTVVARVLGEKVEISTYRGETYGEDHRPEGVRFVATFEEDASRRDFTMNALGYDCLRGDILDPCGGVADISRGILRAIGDPDRRFAEDEQRILRAARFVAEYGFEVDPATREAMARNAAGLVDVAPARVRDELMPLLCGRYPSRGLHLLEECGGLAVVLPEIHRMVGMRQPELHHDKDVYWHTLRVVDAVRPEPDLRLAALLHDVGKPDTFSVDGRGTVHFYEHERVGEAIAEDILRRLHFPAVTRRRVCHLVRRHMYSHRLTKMWGIEGTADVVLDGFPEIPGDRSIRRFVRKLDLVGTDGHVLVDTETVLELNRADILAGSPRAVRTSLRRWAATAAAVAEERSRDLQPRPSSHGPVPGGELIARLGLDPRSDGARIGRIMAAVREAYERGGMAEGDLDAAEAVAREVL